MVGLRDNFLTWDLVILTYNVFAFEKCGHFAAFELPDVL